MKEIQFICFHMLPPEVVSSPVHRALHKLLVFKFQPLQQRATAIENCEKARNFETEITW